jgi:4-amino-4-deoxy-L-arabinose transferase-like glycosyltransferase
MEQHLQGFLASYRIFRTDLSQLLRRLAGERQDLIWLVLLSLVGTIIRIWFLNQPMRYDEARTYLDFVSSGTERLFLYPAPNNHVAHTLLVYLSTLCFGNAPWAIRIPAFVAGVLTIPTAYFCARSVFSRSSGLVATGLVAGSPYLVLFSTNARGYSVITLLTLVLAPLSLYFVRRESAFAGLLVALLWALGLYTIPVMLFPIAMLGVWMFLLAFHVGGLAKVLRLARLLVGTGLLCAVVTVVLYLPVVSVSGVRAIVANQYVLPLSLSEAVLDWPRMVQETWLNFQRDIPFLGRLCLGASMLYGAFHLWKSRRSAFLLVPATLVGIGALLLAMRVVPFRRTWIFLLPLGFCLADVGVMELLRFFRQRTRAAALGVLGLLVALGIGLYLTATDAVSQYPDTGDLPDAEAIALYLKPHLQEGDWILARKNLPLRYYFYRLGIPLDFFHKSGNGNIYVVVRLPQDSFAKVMETYELHLDERDFVVQNFPSALLYLPRGPGE